MVCSLAALPVQVQVPARASGRRQQPAGGNAAVRTQERADSQRPDEESTPERTPKSHLHRKHFIRSSTLPRFPSLTTPRSEPPCVIVRGEDIQPSSPPRHFKLTRQISWFQREKPLLSISACSFWVIMFWGSPHAPPLILQ
ncbi:hypothetical protein F7725_025349 [Dissostichus mawsoni]|uniref:Uncharacterized protein n=1 Tax=Dissostichus mawsoni TaxID=36200 RepID=A0A7J5XAW4_DISMA|nr:hypothetical protein F7725_025349 [Dissostichus mawsoni]